MNNDNTIAGASDDNDTGNNDKYNDIVIVTAVVMIKVKISPPPLPYGNFSLPLLKFGKSKREEKGGQM